MLDKGESKMPSDEELLANIAIGRKPGFTRLYRRYSDSIFRYALMVSGSLSLAEEATQDTFVYMIEHAGAFDVQRSPSALGWLYGITRNRVRALTRAHTRSTIVVNQETCAPSVEQAFKWSKAVDATASAILDLDIDQREVIVLCGLQEIDYSTAADILGVPVGTVRSRLSRARQALRLSLSDAIGYKLEEVSGEV